MPILGVIASGISGHLTPPWPDNSYYQIATTAVGAGGSSTVTFSSIPATYTHLQLRVLSKTTDTSNVEDNTNLYFNGDTTYTNYRGHWLRGDGTTVTASNLQANGYQVYTGVISGSGSSQTSMFGATIIDILEYTNTNKYKTVRILNGNDCNNTSFGFIGMYSNVWMSSSAITSITFTVPGGTNYAQNSRFALYGIKV
jgi:hypothetical protein